MDFSATSFLNLPDSTPGYLGNLIVLIKLQKATQEFELEIYMIW